MTRTAALALLVLASPGTADPGGRIEISPAEARQTVAVMGGDMERSAAALMDAADPAEVANWAFRDIRFNICRVQYDKHQELEEGHKDFAFYDRQVQAMKLVQAANPQIAFFATMRSDYNGYRIGNRNNFPEFIYDPQNDRLDAAAHGRFLADYCIHMHRRGVPVAYLSTAKEIVHFFGPERAVATIESLHRHLDASGVPRPAIVDPGSWSLPQGVEFVDGVVALGRQGLFHAYATHNYRHHDESGWRDFTAACDRAGGGAWNAEAGMGGGDIGMNEAPFGEAVHNMARRISHYRAGIHGEMFFEIWSRGIDRESRSIYFRKGGRATRMRGYWLMKEWTNSVLGGTVVDTACSIRPTIDAIAFRRGDELTLWAVNMDSAEAAEVPVTPRNARLAAGDAAITGWTADTPHQGRPGTLAVDAANNRLTLALPPHSIVRAVFPLAR